MPNSTIISSISNQKVLTALMASNLEIRLKDILERNYSWPINIHIIEKLYELNQQINNILIKQYISTNKDINKLINQIVINTDENIKTIIKESSNGSQNDDTEEIKFYKERNKILSEHLNNLRAKHTQHCLLYTSDAADE